MKGYNKYRVHSKINIRIHFLPLPTDKECDLNGSIDPIDLIKKNKCLD